MLKQIVIFWNPTVPKYLDFKKYLIKTKGRIITAGEMNLEINSICLEEDIASIEELSLKTNKNLKLNILENVSKKFIKEKDWE